MPGCLPYKAAWYNVIPVLVCLANQRMCACVAEPVSVTRDAGGQAAAPETETAVLGTGLVFTLAAAAACHDAKTLGASSGFVNGMRDKVKVTSLTEQPIMLRST